MGIPKFYRWLSERYPLLNQPTDVGETPLVDNLYLDMNGIIHNCTHGNDPGTKLTEEEMVVKIFTYLDKLFQVVKPQRLLFMAIDGVAPRAKMNQQRSRRFRSARDAEEARSEATRKGEVISPDSFDSNCITPGTPFMARLGAHLRYFVRKKVAEDPAWQRPHVIFSGHDVPGEGEHKIMEHIRHQKRSPNYTPNQRHCLYGLDADLIMLALVTHEPHFCLLREVVSFSGGSRGRPSREVLENPCQESFILFQIGLLREYLELEFKNDVLPFAYNVERVIDDFVLFCMLIGNDFLPALPTLDIAEGALDKLFGIYKQLLPSMGGYLTHAGQLHRGRLEMVLHQLANLELETLEQRAQDAEFMEQKKSERAARGSNAWQPQACQQELDEADRFQVELDAMGGADELEVLAKLEAEPASEGPTMMGRKARELMLSGQGDQALIAFKSKYYSEKLGIHKHDAAGRRRVAACFIEGLHWVLEYYYRGVASWTWFFPYHFAPMISDMTDIQEFDVAFQLGQPFLPFQQLLGVLPSASFKLLPEPFQWLMTDANSPIHDFYPTDFRVDMEGKRNDWEGVVLIPFIDEARLLAASHTVGPAKLSKEEANRNKLGELLVFSHQPDSHEEAFCMSTLPSHFATVTHCNSRCVQQPPPPPLPHGELGFLPQVLAGTRTGPGSPSGYPTLKTLTLTAHLQQAGVEVFGQGSRKESLILQVQDKMSDAVAQGLISAEQVAGSILGERCWVRWPFLQEASVQAVSDRSHKVDKVHGVVPHGEREATDWAVSSSQLTRQFLIKHGMEVGRCELVLHVCPCEGLMRQLDGTVEKRFAKKEILYPLQASLRRNPAPDPRRDPSTVGSQLGALKFETGQKALFLGRAYYGCVATVLPPVNAGLTRKGSKVLAASSSNMLHIEVAPTPPAAATAQATARRILGGVRVQYLPSGQVARWLHMSSRTLGKITGNLWLQTGDEKVDLGLCVKHGAKGMCVPDYVQAQPDNNGWAYSQALVTVIEQYKARHSWVFTMVDQDPDSNDYQLSHTFQGLDKDSALKKMRDAKGWLQSLPLFKRPLVKTSAQVAAEDAIRALQAALPPGLTKPLAPVELENVKPTLLLPPTEKGGVASELAGGTFDLGDRVACLKSTGSPPLGSRGTVVGVHEGAVEVLFDADFIGGGDLQGRCQGRCGVMLPPADLLNLAKPHFSNITGADAPRQIGKSSASSAWSPAVDAARQPSRDLPIDAAANGNTRGLANNAVPANGSGQGQPRASPRPKAPQPQGPPDKDARGFIMGRGRSMPLPPGAGHSDAKFAAPAPGASPPTDSAATSSSPSGQQGGPSAAANLGQQLLAQLQGQSAVGARSDSGVDLGRGLLQQLQQGMTAPTAIPQHTLAHDAVTQTDAGRALLAQLQKSLARQKADSLADPTAQSAASLVSSTQPQPGLGSTASAVSFGALLRGAAGRQQTQAQPVVQSEPPAANHPGASSFDQLLRAAASDHASSQNIAGAPPPGSDSRQQPSAAAGVAVAEAYSDSDPGRLLLQQLQQGGLQAPALGLQQQLPPGSSGRLPQQSSVQSHTRHDDAQAGKQLLQQLQRVTMSEGSGAIIRSPAAGARSSAAPQPMPSAPPAPASMLLQNASNGTTGRMDGDHNQVGLGASGAPRGSGQPQQPPGFPGLRASAPGGSGRAGRNGPQNKQGRG
ncbi:MAG: 5 -3 exoribonuclease 1, partial [Trebouxia sp. A1-2]